MSSQERPRSKQGRERPPSSSGRSNRPSSAAPREPPPDTGAENNAGGGAGENTFGYVTPASRERAPVTVGRSLEGAASAEALMDMVCDKLKLLDYERDFCKRKKNQRKPLNRVYFAYQSNDNQFFYFTGLVSWLLGLAGVEMKEAKEFDDPNQTCNNILNALKKLGFAAPSYHSSRLTSGWGKEVCGVLDGLADYVLEKRNFTYRRPVYLPDGYKDEADVDDDGNDVGAEAADQFARPDYGDAEAEEAYMETDFHALAPGAPAAAAQKKAEDPEAEDKAILQSKIDPNLWKVELERVAPKLRILVNADAKDWRSHLEEVHDHKKKISSSWPESKSVLERLRGDLNTSLDKLITREKFLNEQYEHLISQYRASRTQLTEVQETYNKRTESISDRNNELHRIKEQLEDMKHLMDEKGTNISDATPVVRIKNAIKKLSEELQEMEVRIGVVSNTLLGLSMKNKRLLQAQAVMDSDDEEDTAGW